MKPLEPLPADFLPLTPSRRLVVTSTDGARIAVQLHGEGNRPTVVLVHGWTLSTTFWVRVVRRLAPDLRVVTYDQRGHGRSGPVPEGGFTPDGIAADLAAVLDAAVPDGERAVVAGHSMGAMALVAFAARHPGVLERRVGAGLLASTGVEQLMGRMAVLPRLHAGGRPARPARPGTVRARRGLAGDRHPTAAVPRVGSLRTSLTRRTIGDAQSLHRMPLRLARATLVHATMSRTATPQERAFCTDIVLACPQRTYEGFAQMLGALDLSADLSALTVPVQVLVGTHDRLTPPWHAHRMAAALPDPIGLVEVQGAGHMTPLTAPDAVAAAIRRLAAGVAAAPVPVLQESR